MKNSIKNLCVVLSLAATYFPLTSHAAEFMGSHAAPEGGRCYHYGNWWKAGDKVYANKGTNCQKEQRYIGAGIEMYRNGRRIQDSYIEGTGNSLAWGKYTKHVSTTANHACRSDRSKISEWTMWHRTVLVPYGSSRTLERNNLFAKKYYYFCG